MNTVVTDEFLTVPVSQVKAKKSQVRKSFNDKSIQELGQSILAEGLIQPIIVSPQGENGFMEIQKGERRWRAHIAVGLETIPVIVRQSKENSVDVIASELVENLQREDLSVMEIAQALNDFKDENGKRWTHEKIAKRLGKHRSWITKVSTMTSLPECAMGLYEAEITRDVSALYSLRSLYSKNPVICEDLCASALQSGSITRKAIEEALASCKPNCGDDDECAPLTIEPDSASDNALESAYESFGEVDCNDDGTYDNDMGDENFSVDVLKEDEMGQVYTEPLEYFDTSSTSNPSEPQDVKTGPINFGDTTFDTPPAKSSRNSGNDDDYVYQDDDEPIVLSRTFKKSPDYEGELEGNDKENKEKTFKFIKLEEVILNVEVDIDGDIKKGVLELHRKDVPGVFWVKITKGKKTEVVRVTANQLTLLEMA